MNTFIPLRKDTLSKPHLSQLKEQKESSSLNSMTSSFRPTTKNDHSFKKMPESNVSLGSSDEEEIKNYEQKEKYYLRIQKPDDGEQSSSYHKLEYVGIV